MGKIVKTITGSDNQNSLFSKKFQVVKFGVFSEMEWTFLSCTVHQQIFSESN